jgi:undecaprenyl-phosphate 4-deoxy-4-formamido-L-arabinose transferase
MDIEISIVVPVYNSERIVEKLYDRVANVIETNFSQNFEMIFVDDGSKDQSFDQLKGLRKRDDRVKIIQLKRNYGQQNATLCGLNHAKGAYIFTIDDDLQQPPEEIPKLYKNLKEGYDAVFGIPLEKKHSFYRGIGTKMIDTLLNQISQKPKNLRVSSFRGMPRHVVQRVVEDKTSFVYLAPMILRNAKKTGNVFVNHEERQFGKSNYTFMKLVKLYMKLGIYYSFLSKWIVTNQEPQFEIGFIEL